MVRSCGAWVTLLAVALAICAAGCERDQARHASRPSAGELRLISLSPAISRTLVDFGLEDRIVGRTPHCKSIDQTIPVAGDLLNIDFESLIRLNPTHILVQPPAAGTDRHLIELAEQRKWVIGQWRLNRREDIEMLIRELPVLLFAEGTAERNAAAERSAALLDEIEGAFSPEGSSMFSGRTLILHSLDPVLVSGKGTYLDDILTTLGAQNATTGNGWIQLSLEDIVRLNPEAVVIVRPGADDESAAGARQELQGLRISAVEHDRIEVSASVDGEMPSSGIIHVANEFKEILRRFEEKTR